MTYPTAPLQLSIAGDHRAQMCIQAASTLPYNESQRYVYASVLSAQTDTDEKEIKIALVYAYDTGIGRAEYDAVI